MQKHTRAHTLKNTHTQFLSIKDAHLVVNVHISQCLPAGNSSFCTTTECKEVVQ